MTTKNDSLEATGKAAADALIEMVEALECAYTRLEELTVKRAEWLAEGSLSRKWQNESEYDALIASAGECASREEAEQRIQEDALSVEVRSGWYDPCDSSGAISEEFCILLATGGPAVRIRGELNGHCEPCRAWLEVQDWGTPWTQYFDIDQDTLLAYARCFYYGEG